MDNKKLYRIYARKHTDGGCEVYQGSVLSPDSKLVNEYVNRVYPSSVYSSSFDSEEYPMPDSRVFSFIKDLTPIPEPKSPCLKGNPSYDLMM